MRHRLRLFGRSSFRPCRAVSGCCADADGSVGQSDLVSGRSCFGHMLLQVSVEQFVRVQFRRVAGQVEDLDLVLVFLDPFGYRLGVMYPQIVQDQQNPLLPSMHKPLHETDQDLGVQRAGKDLPAHWPLLVTVEITLNFERLALASTLPLSGFFLKKKPPYTILASVGVLENRFKRCIAGAC